MREILFRGKSDNGEWVEGYYAQIPEPSIGAMFYIGTGEYVACEDTRPCIVRVFQRQHPYFSNANPICVVESEICEVDLATIGQYTGLHDKNGKKIYEGDIVTYPDGDGGYEYCDETISSGVVTWGDESALFYITNNYSAEFPDIWDRVDEMEVIGNIHDNPELLEGSK